MTFCILLSWITLLRDRHKGRVVCSRLRPHLFKKYQYKLERNTCSSHKPFFSSLSEPKHCYFVIHTLAYLLFVQKLQHNSIYLCLSLADSTHSQNKLWTKRSWTTSRWLMQWHQWCSLFLVNISLVDHTPPHSSCNLQTCIWSSPQHMKCFHDHLASGASWW